MSNNSRRHNTRVLLLQALYQWQLADSSYNEVCEQFEESYFEQNMDKEYFKGVLSFIIHEYPDIDQNIEYGLDRAIGQLDPIIINILRIGTYELMRQSHIPFKAIINEALLLTKTFGSEDSHKYVNGVLDKIAGKLRKDEIERTT